MPCDKPGHVHRWTKEGTLEIAACETLCWFCEIDGKYVRDFQSSWHLRRHILGVHMAEYPGLVVEKNMRARKTAASAASGDGSRAQALEEMSPRKRGTDLYAETSPSKRARRSLANPRKVEEGPARESGSEQPPDVAMARHVEKYEKKQVFFETLEQVVKDGVKVGLTKADMTYELKNLSKRLLDQAHEDNDPDLGEVEWNVAENPIYDDTATLSPLPDLARPNSLAALSENGMPLAENGDTDPKVASTLMAGIFNGHTSGDLRYLENETKDYYGDTTEMRTGLMLQHIKDYGTSEDAKAIGTSTQKDHRKRDSYHFASELNAIQNEIRDTQINDDKVSSEQKNNFRDLVNYDSEKDEIKIDVDNDAAKGARDKSEKTTANRGKEKFIDKAKRRVSFLLG